MWEDKIGSDTQAEDIKNLTIGNIWQHKHPTAFTDYRLLLTDYKFYHFSAIS